ncbi:hypothetical protein E3N88_30914 [Mikania micrantha]|uniref:GAF domain-containing protein n=1 Tax=Mikania micrantha TaxID=192012 RepID=A0A5N6MN61_9ASTR|nr:hypothetical protein E3N88_30914 [Mikania micrantha]
MEAMNSHNHFNIMLVIILQLVPEVESIVGEVFESFNFHNESGLLQFWAYSTNPDSEEIGTKHYVLGQDDQHSADVGARGQLVLPVFFDEGAGNKLVGVIEYVTTVRKESYVEDFEQIHNLLKDKGLKSTYMGKTIKVVMRSSRIA